ncbi:hypothetical protein JCM21900_002368 [Sporobolomyces salmonicolor]
MDRSSSPFTAPSVPDCASADDPSISPRVAAIAKLKRAASTREFPSPSSSRSSSTSRSGPRPRPRPTAAPFIDDDTSLFLSPRAPGGSALERTASLLARQLAMAKLTGSAPPTPPSSFFTPDEPLPTLEELQHRARAKIAAGAALRRNNTVASGMLAGGPALAALRRNNTVTGAGVGGMAELAQGATAGQEEPPAVSEGDDQPLARAEARVNLMRKLSARRLEKPAPAAAGSDRLGVVGRIGRARPRSGSVGALDWRWGSSTPPPPPPPPPPAESLPLPGNAPPTALSTQLGAPLSLSPLHILSSTSSGHKVGISFDSAHPQESQPHSPAVRTTADRSETSFSLRSSGGSWDRQSEDNNAWEFADALRSHPGDWGEEDQDDVEVIRNSQQQQKQPSMSERQQLDFERTPRGWEDGDSSFPTTTSTARPFARTINRVEQHEDDNISPRTSPTSDKPPPDWPSPPSAYPSSTSRRRRRSVEQKLFPPLAAPRRPSSSASNSTAAPAPPNPSVVLSSYTSDREARLRGPLVPSFGIAAVEYSPDGPDTRKRGSSASSSLALLEGRRFRGSDALLLREGTGEDESEGVGSAVRWDRVGSVVSNGSDADEEREADRTIEAFLPAARAGDGRGRSQEEEGKEREEEQRKEHALEAQERDLVDKVEKKREEALARGKEGAFSPPAEGYQFPPSSTISSPRESRDFAGEKDAKPQPSAHQLFDQLASTSSPLQPQCKPRDFPFKLPFQTSSAPCAVTSSPIIPAPLSPTAVADDPLASRVSSTSPKRLHSPTASRTMRTHEMIKSPSTDSVASTHSAGASSYQSPVTMQRDFSSSSGESYQFSPRVSPLPAGHLPSNRILAKLDSILGPEALASDEPTALDQPPRKLLLHAPMLQVVNANTVKDRHLFLFNDLLVIAKPLVLDHPLTGQPVPPTLDNHFIVKSIVELQQLKVAATIDEPPEDPSSSSSGKKRHPLLVAFVDRFANDATRAIAALVQKGGLANNGPTIANLLFRNSDLNRNQLGAYLANPNHRHVLRAYIERFRFGGVRIDDALRLFLMSVRLPYDQNAAEYVLGVLATVWTETNGATGFDPSLTFSLILAILGLSDALHRGSNGAGDPAFFPSSRRTALPSVDDFIGRFREHDTRMVVPEDLLSRIYTSVRRERIEQASDNSIFSMTPDIEASIEPAKLPTRLTYRIPSDVFTVSIPAPDPKFTIKLHGTDLQFDPPVLSFARSATQKFRVTGTALGVRVMVLIKRGANAPRYQGLPLNKAFSVERAFMQHTFQVSFTNHLDVKRKYMFSTMDPSIRSEWLRIVRERIAAALSTPPPASQALAAAQAVSIQVLRDVFLLPEEPAQVSSAAPSPRPNLAAPRFGTPVTPAPPRTRLGTPTRPGAGALMRSHSVSRLYAAQYQHETELSTDRRQSSAHAQQQLAKTGSAAAADVARLLAAESKSTFAKTGHELVLTTEQNSLLPLVLEFLNTGLEAAPHPVSLQGSAFQLPPLSPSPHLSSSSTPTFSFINPNTGTSPAF